MASIETMIEDLENKSDDLTPWEASFLSDVSETVNAGNLLTEAQEDKLQELWLKYSRRISRR